MNHLEDSTLNEYLDRRLGDTERRAVAEHLDACAACQSRLDELQRVFQSLNTVSDVRLEKDLSAQILARLAAESRPWSAPRWLRVALFAQVLTAGVLLVTQLSAGQALMAGASSAFSEALAAVTTSLPLIQSQQTLIERVTELSSHLQIPSPGILLSPAQWLLIIGLTLLLWLVGNGLLLRSNTNGAR